LKPIPVLSVRTETPEGGVVVRVGAHERGRTARTARDVNLGSPATER